jgi:predicted phosphoribosyltransferase
MPLPYRDRRDAGRQLARLLDRYANQPDVLVLGLPRGGVPVAYEVAVALAAPLDVFLVRKLGVPGHEELAMGAIASGGVRVLNAELVADLKIMEDRLDAVVAREAAELARRDRLYRGDRPPPNVEGKTVIVVDDGLATGSTMLAAIAALHPQRPARLVCAVPISSRTVCEEIRGQVDEMICAATPDSFYAVGVWYEDFRPTSDDEVQALLRQAGERTLPLPPAAG